MAGSREGYREARNPPLRRGEAGLVTAKGNMLSGNGLTIAYTAFNKPATITRGTASVSFDHDPEHQRYAQTSLSGVTLYISAGGVLAERFAGTGGSVRWTNYLIVGGRFIGIHVENSDETTLTRYFHTDHLGSIAVITNEAGAWVERLSVACPRVGAAEPEERLGSAPPGQWRSRPLGLHHQRDLARLHRARAPG